MMINFKYTIKMAPFRHLPKNQINPSSIQFDKFHQQCQHVADKIEHMQNQFIPHTFQV